MHSTFHWLDWVILAVYFMGTMSIGLYFYRRTRSTEGFTTANRSLPGWVCGLSIFATFLSSISYLALPGKSFASNWNPFVFSLSLPLVTFIAVRYFLPYYRNQGEVSAYAALEKRFGLWARIYASVFYLLTQIARIAVVMYLMALPMEVIFGWNITTILIITGICVTLYSFVGGIFAVIWTDAIQALVLLVGAIICLAVMLINTPGGPATVFAVANEQNKFSLGSLSPDLTTSTFWVVLVYGIVINLQNFGIDQSYVQRYVASRSEEEARRSLWLGGLLYVPVSAVFFFIGTTLFVYYQSPLTSNDNLQEVKTIVARQRLIQEGEQPEGPTFIAKQNMLAEELEPKDIGDRVFPHFISRHLPPGLTGLLVAAIFAAAMSTVSTSLNSSATLIMSDFYQRLIRPNASERQSLFVLYGATILWGVLGTGLALVLVQLTEGALEMWWTLAGIFGGGITGLFLLGMISKRAKNPAAILGVIIGILIILWLSMPKVIDYLLKLPEDSSAHQFALQLHHWLERWGSSLHAYLVPVIGTLTIFLVGILFSRGKSDE